MSKMIIIQVVGLALEGEDNIDLEVVVLDSNLGYLGS
jgi:hypothetical protein